MGLIISILILVLWGIHLLYSLTYAKPALSDPVFYFHILLQGYLYTGLFITAHDAMHGNISPQKMINKALGRLASFLFAGLSYSKLLRNHITHHRNPGEDNDPDFYNKSQNFFVWWFVFMKRYTTITQLIIMALLYNVLKLWFDESSIISFWVIPAFLGTLQLFYFGTYIPHKYPHTAKMKPHNARTLKKNHLWGMLTCYFFGYHFEHHESPRTPWWQMYKLK
jgi:beta-carotene ketolase (CrtW type)